MLTSQNNGELKNSSFQIWSKTKRRSSIFKTIDVGVAAEEGKLVLQFVEYMVIYLRQSTINLRMFSSFGLSSRNFAGGCLNFLLDPWREEPAFVWSISRTRFGWFEMRIHKWNTRPVGYLPGRDVIGPVSTKTGEPIVYNRANKGFIICRLVSGNCYVRCLDIFNRTPSSAHPLCRQPGIDAPPCVGLVLGYRPPSKITSASAGHHIIIFT